MCILQWEKIQLILLLPFQLFCYRKGSLSRFKSSALSRCCCSDHEFTLLELLMGIRNDFIESKHKCDWKTLDLLDSRLISCADISWFSQQKAVKFSMPNWTWISWVSSPCQMKQCFSKPLTMPKLEYWAILAVHSLG